jgi:hypothetical protein
MFFVSYGVAGGWHVFALTLCGSGQGHTHRETRAVLLPCISPLHVQVPSFPSYKRGAVSNGHASLSLYLQMRRFASGFVIFSPL